VSHSQLVQPKRGYLANLTSIPPIVYPFQFNPSQVTDSKSVTWQKKTPVVSGDKKGGADQSGNGASSATSTPRNALSDLRKNLSVEMLGRTFSAAEIKQLEKEGDRTISFKFEIDGRETRPGEPDRRRNAAGDIIGDLAVIRSFVYPRVGDLSDLLAATRAATNAGSDQAPTFTDLWFNQPPTCLVVLGDMTMEGYVTELKITETLFNQNLDPTRAEVDISLIEKIDSVTFIVDAAKRIGRLAYYTAYEDIGKVII
jgi:hypothetical protein